MSVRKLGPYLRHGGLIATLLFAGLSFYHLNKHKDSERWQEFEINQVQRLIDYLDVVKTPHSESFETPKLHNDFWHFYNQYDIRRNKNFNKTFPSMVEWYETL